MATIKALVGSQRAEQLYGLKDRLKAERVLDENPMKLNRTQFEKYLAAKAESLITDFTHEGMDIDAAYHKAEIYLTIEDSKWRIAAKAYNEAHQS